MSLTNSQRSSKPAAPTRQVQPSSIEPDAPGAAPSDPPSSPASSRAMLDEIGRLIRGDDESPAEPPGEAPTKPGEPGKPKAPKSLDDVAKSLGVDPAALYDLEIPLRGDGKDKSAKKLGELKDYFAAQDDHQLDRLAWEETRGREQASIARERAELAELMAAIPRDKLNQDVLNIARQKIDAHVASERRKTLERIPTWSDDNVRTVELTGIVEHLADYGFPASALHGITDSRMLAYMRDNWLRMKRLQDALDKVKPVRTAQPGRAKANASAPEPVRASRESARSLEKQVDAISKLLRG